MAGARSDTWMPIYWGDYAKDTGHLGAAQHGAYLLLMKHYWVTGQPLPDDDAQLWRIACADSLAHWRRLKPVVLAFFERRDGRLHHSRVEKELVAAGRNADRRAELARRAATVRWTGRSTGEGMPDAMPPAMPGAMPAAMRDECPPPSPKTLVETPISSVTPPNTDELDASGILKGTTRREAFPTTARAQPIAADWLPSVAVQERLAKLRPDLTPAIVERRMIDFRSWCAERNTTTHSPDATWFSFMAKTRPDYGNDYGSDYGQHRDSRQRQSSLAAARDGIAAAFAGGSVSDGGGRDAFLDHADGTAGRPDDS
jgi:uncharacterized protein YdaU (DUF1376 family)